MPHSGRGSHVTVETALTNMPKKKVERKKATRHEFGLDQQLALECVSTPAFWPSLQLVLATF